VKIRLRALRSIIREVILINEVGSNGSFPGQPYGRNVLSPDINAREQIGALTAKAMDTVGDDDALPDHLRDPKVSPEDCLGPVGKYKIDPPYVGQDPFARDVGVLPTSSIRRG